MKTLTQKRGTTKLLVCVLSMVVLLTTLLPLTAFAANNFWQGGTVISTETALSAFNTGGDNKLTISAKAYEGQQGATTVTLKLQKQVFGAYFTERTISIPIDNQSRYFLIDYPVDSNTNYRIVNSCNNGYAQVSLGIGTWK